MAAKFSIGHVTEIAKFGKLKLISDHGLCCAAIPVPARHPIEERKKKKNLISHAGCSEVVATQITERVNSSFEKYNSIPPTFPLTLHHI